MAFPRAAGLRLRFDSFRVQEGPQCSANRLALGHSVADPELFEAVEQIVWDSKRYDTSDEIFAFRHELEAGLRV
jgi:hypothetical protein